MYILHHNEAPTKLPIANKDVAFPASTFLPAWPYPSPYYLSYRTYPFPSYQTYLSCQTYPFSSHHPQLSSDYSVQTYYTPIKLNNFPIMQIISRLHSLSSLIADDVSGLWQYVLQFRYLNILRKRLLN